MADTDPGGWAVSEPAVVRFDNSDTVSARTIDLIVRYGRDFRYDRLSVAVTTVSPSGRQRRDTAVVMLPTCPESLMSAAMRSELSAPTPFCPKREPICFLSFR